MALIVLVIAAALEVGGDALCRAGMRSGRAIPLIAGGAVLWLYGIVVNAPRWDFGRLLGVYITVFFVVSQLVAILAFHEPIRKGAVLGGGLIVAGGLILVICGSGPASIETQAGARIGP